MRKFIYITLSVLLSFLNLSCVFAANGQGSVSSRTDTVNINDYSTDNWDRFEFNYEFESGPETKETFGVPTQTDTVAKNPQLDNMRRNKDAAFLPPSYGIFSGEIPTDASSAYHENTKPEYAVNATNKSSAINSFGGTLQSSMGNMSDTGTLTSTSTMPNISKIQNNIDYRDDYWITESKLYEDGSIGTLRIPKLDLSVKVFEGETLSNMKRGVGHFEFTSAWDGNVGIAGHNRGSSDYLNGIWNLKNGDEIIFTTKYGRRTYEVYSKEKISDTDYSKLGWSNENMITLITCVENVPNKRWVIQASETK